MVITDCWFGATRNVDGKENLTSLLFFQYRIYLRAVDRVWE